MDPLTHLPLLFHVKLWDLPNINEIIGGEITDIDDIIEGYAPVG